MNFYSDEGLAVCQICGKGFHFITANHMNSHGITIKEYHEQYPGAPLFRKGFYDKPRNVKKTKLQPIEPIIEELAESDGDDSFSDDTVITELSKVKMKTTTGVKYNDPMEEKLNIISYLKNKFRGMKNNYMVVKTLASGALEYQLITDMADPINKVVFDFPLAFWHNSQIGVAEHVKHQKLKANGWRVIIINATMPRIKDVADELNKRDL